MPSIVLRDLTQEEYAYLATAATLTQSPILGFCLYAAVEHAAAVIENSGLSDVAKLARPDSMRRRGPLTEVEERVAKRAEQPASVDGLAELREENNALRDEITRLRGWMYNMRRAARRAEETVSDIVAVADEEC
jgi:hypothetical protein